MWRVGAHQSFRFHSVKRTPEGIRQRNAAARYFARNSYDVYDGAHFPTVDLDTARADQDRVSLPSYLGQSGERNLPILFNAGD